VTKRVSDVDEELEVDESLSLFWQPGKHGFYSPRPGKNTPERLNAFRNVGRYCVLCWLFGHIVCSYSCNTKTEAAFHSH